MGLIQAPIGLKDLNFHPAKDTGYDTAVPLGSAVKAYLTIETNDLSVYGDDVLELDQSVFKRGTVSTESWLDDIELETKVYGGTYQAASGSGAGKEAVDNASDMTPEGALSYVRVLLKRDESTKKKSEIYRAIVLPRVTASKSSQKEEADTKGDSLDPKTHMIDFTIQQTSDGVWRYRADFDTLEAARAYITSKTGSTG